MCASQTYLCKWRVVIPGREKIWFGVIIIFDHEIKEGPLKTSRWRGCLCGGVLNILLSSSFSGNAASYDEGRSEGHGSLDGRTAGIWTNEPRFLVSDESAALPRYTHIYRTASQLMRLSQPNIFLFLVAVHPHILFLFNNFSIFCKCFCPSRIYVREEHAYEAYAPSSSPVLCLQHAPSQRAWPSRSCQHQSDAWLPGEPSEGDRNDQSPDTRM